MINKKNELKNTPFAFIIFIIMIHYYYFIEGSHSSSATVLISRMFAKPVCLIILISIFEVLEEVILDNF